MDNHRLMRFALGILLAVAFACGMASGCVLVRQNDAAVAAIDAHVLRPDFRYTVGDGPVGSSTGVPNPSTCHPPKPRDLTEVPYTVLVPYFHRGSYFGQGDNEYLPATRLAGTGERLSFPARLWIQLFILPVMGGIFELLPYPETCVIAFAPNCWPVTIMESGQAAGPSFIYASTDQPREVPVGAKWRMDLVFFPRSREMDWEVAAASGCSVGKFPVLPSILARNLGAVYQVVDHSDLSREDREMVFGHLLDLIDNVAPIQTREETLEQLRQARKGLVEKLASLRSEKEP